MGLRPRTRFVKKLKSRRCSRCGAKMNSQQIRCKRCGSTEKRPQKKAQRNA